MNGVRRYVVKRHVEPSGSADAKRVLVEELCRHYSDLFAVEAPPAATVERWRQSPLDDLTRYAKNWARLLGRVRAGREVARTTLFG